MNDGSVTPAEGPSDVGAPMKFTFTAPTQKVDRTGFLVNATSRAGVTEGDWSAGLGTNWSGRISITTTNTGDEGDSELLTWSFSSATGITIELTNGEGWAYGYTEVHDLKRFRQRAQRGGAITLITPSTIRLDGSLDDCCRHGRRPLPEHRHLCDPRERGLHEGREGARAELRIVTLAAETADRRCSWERAVPGVDGKIDDPNHLQGSKTEVKKGTGSRGTGTVTTTITWDLARQGTGK